MKLRNKKQTQTKRIGIEEEPIVEEEKTTTEKGAEQADSSSEEVATSSSLIIGVVVAALLIIAVVVDVSCHFVNKIGEDIFVFSTKDIFTKIDLREIV